MNVLFLSIAWPLSGEKNLYTDLMDEFVMKGHKVYVVGTSKDETKLDFENGIEVLRISSGQIRKTSNLRKILSLLPLGNNMYRGIRKSYPGIIFNLIIFPTPSITLSPLIKKLKRKYHSHIYLLLKDIWPQGSVDHNVFRKYSIPWIYFRLHEIRLYRNADTIGCMSPLGVEYVLRNNNFIPEDKVEVCPNSIKPAAELERVDLNDIRTKYNIPQDACVFIFSGNLGVGHGLHFLADAIKSLSDYPGAYFVIGGSGTHYQYFQDMLDEYAPTNALLYNWLPREDFNKILATSDVGLIFLYKYTSPQFPSRLLSYLDYSKPVLCAVNKETDIGTIVEESACGRSVLHGNLEGFNSAVRFFSENPDERVKMGENGRKLLLEKYTVSQGYEIIMNHFDEEQFE